MNTAFQNRESVKAELLARIDSHIEAGTLVPGPTAWDGQRGSALGVSIEGTDASQYSAAFGYPLALATLLDPLSEMLRDPGLTNAFVRDWVACVTPGADLMPLPAQIAVMMLEDHKAVSPLVNALVALHRAEIAGNVVSRKEWADLRASILCAVDAAQSPLSVAVLNLCEAGCWSAAHSRSILTTMIPLWTEMIGLLPDPDWSADDSARADAVLKGLWEDQGRKPAGPKGPHYPQLFAARDPDLARRFEANLTRTNDLYLARIRKLSGTVLAVLASASKASADQSEG